MHFKLNGVEIIFSIIFLAIATNAFFVGFQGLEISRYFFYLVIALIVLTHFAISRTDIVFIIGCLVVLAMKITNFHETVSDTLMIVTLAWGLSYIRYDFTKIHFKIILIYGLITIIVGLLQILGVEQLHAWNTFMFDEKMQPSSLIYTPLDDIPQSQIRPPGLFHNGNILTLFVCYFFALTLNKSALLLPLGLLAVWISGSKIAFIFVFFYPLVMMIAKNRIGYSYSKIYFSMVVFFLIMWMISPEFHDRRYAVYGFFASTLFRLFSINEYLNIGYDFNSIEMYSAGASYFKREAGELITGIFGFIYLFLPFIFLYFKRFLYVCSQTIPEISTILFVSLATPILGDPFAIILLYPIFRAFRKKKIEK